jgi:large subunit ribosomal protein L22
MVIAIDNRLENESVASSRFVRVTPRKARRVVNELRGRSVQDAIAICKFSPHAVSENVLKLLYSATANANALAERTSSNVDEKDLVITRIFVDEGATMKRWRPRAKGKADRILKRTSHITVVVAPKNEGDL